MTRSRLCFVTAVPLTVDAFVAPYALGAATNFDVHVVSSARGRLDAEWHEVPIARTIAVAEDLRSIRRLVSLFRRLRPHVVHSFTPKAGLVAAVAGRIAGVPVRLHTFTGQVWATEQGMRRHVLRAADRTTARFVTHPLVDGWSQRSFLIEEGVLTPGSGSVLAFGSVSGAASHSDGWIASTRRKTRGRLRLGDDDVLVAYVGRIARDKGLIDLADAFVVAHRQRPSLRLLIAGPDEAGLGDDLAARVEVCGGAARIEPGFVDRAAETLVAADVFCLPSLREGFGSIVIEAAACGVPSVLTDVYGLADVARESTSLRVPAQSPSAIATALVGLVDEPIRRRTMGESARARVSALFDPRYIESGARELYRSLASSGST